MMVSGRLYLWLVGENYCYAGGGGVGGRTLTAEGWKMNCGKCKLQV